MAGIGVDIVEIERVTRSLKRSARFAPTVFSRTERAYGKARPRPHQHLAACFAAKEAFLKALGEGIYSGIPLPQIEVVRRRSGEPWLRLGKEAKSRLAKRGYRTATVTLSHNRSSAVAVVLLQ